MRLNDFSDIENTMTITEKVLGRKIGIIGMARSGMSAAKLASRHGAQLFVSDGAPAEKLTTQIEQLKKDSIPFEVGGHTEQLLQSDYLVLSPGVPLNADIVVKAQELGLPCFSELEFASWFCKAKILAITGSNGKTTTVTLIGEILKTAGIDAIVCGNVGLPFSEVVDNLTPSSIAVVEVSTFQLELIEEFKPNIAAILNLTPDHLDRHADFEEYKQLKYRIATNMTSEDYLLLNADDKILIDANIETLASKLFFSTTRNKKYATHVNENMLFVNLDKSGTEIINKNDIGIPGPHNLQNAAVASLATLLAGVKKEAVAQGLRSFTGVEHRLEFVEQIAGISFINDSKATNVDSVCWALQSQTEKVFLISGGRDKGASYTPIIDAGKNVISKIIAIGEARQKIHDELANVFDVQFAESIEGAVEKAFEMASPGDVVLLSPGCSSFDMFKNYEERGIAFKNAVHSLRKSSNSNETIVS